MADFDSGRHNDPSASKQCRRSVEHGMLTRTMRVANIYRNEKMSRRAAGHTMKRQRFQFSAALFAVVTDEDRFLSVRRSGTGWMDGNWSLPAGAHDGNESYVTGALRELNEETGLLANPDDCRLLHVQQVFTGSDEWMGIYIGIGRFSGLPRLMEPEKHDRVEWRALTAQSDPVVPYVLAALKEISLGSMLSTYNEQKH